MNDELKDMLPAKGASLVGFAGLGSLPPAANGGWPVGLVIALALNQDIITQLPLGPQLDYTREIPPGQRPAGQPGPWRPKNG